MRLLRNSATVLGAAGLALAAAVPGASAAHRPAGSGRPAPVIEASAPSLHPEGVAWDPTRRAFLVSSVRHGTVSVVRTDGSVRTLASDPVMVSTFGVHVDAARHRFLVAYGDIGHGERSGPDTLDKVSGVGIFDLATGRPLHLVDLAIGPGNHAANDLTVDRWGNAYVTDPASDTVYRIDTAGHASVLVSDPRLASPSIGLNGIVWDPAGFLLIVRYSDGTLFRVPLRDPAAFTPVQLERPLVGGDGMALRPDGDLVVVTNSLGSPGPDAVTVLRSRGGAWQAAHVVSRVEPWPGTSPTTVAVTPYGDYAVSGRLELLLTGTTSDQFTLRRV
ncbi:MAG: SMP-30/gluconolactonase/LRE family protein [Mycobacteriales bacterium]